MSLLTSIGEISATAQSISNGVSTVNNLLSGNYSAVLAGLGQWSTGMQVASWRGIPFAVRDSTIIKGRRVAEHVYPYRDTIYAEDMGRGVRRYSFRGFLVGDDVLRQSAQMQTAAEQEGPGVLTHPALGQLTCACRSIAIRQGVAGRVVEIDFDFVETAPVLYPSLLDATQSILQAAGLSGLAAAVSDFQANVLAPIQEGADVAVSIINTVQGWSNIAQTVVGDASMIWRSVSTLAGNNGRYSSGTANTNTAALLSANTTARTNVASAITSATTLPTSSSPATNTATIATGITSVASAVVAAVTAPSDQIRLLQVLANYSPLVIASTAPLGAALFAAQTATAALCRRSAIMQLCIACSNYQPASSQDALAVLGSVVDLLDAEMLAAADGGDTTTWQAFRETRKSLVNDLTGRAAQLPEVRTVTTRETLPSLQLAYRLYEDATRSDDLIARADPIHPAFMPISFEALAS